MDRVWVAIYVLAGLCAFLLSRSVYLQYRVNSLEEAANRAVDVVKTLSEALETINDGYKDHEKRILKLEEVEDASETEDQYLSYMVPIEKLKRKRICKDCAYFRLTTEDYGYGHCKCAETPFITVAKNYKDCPYFE